MKRMRILRAPRSFEPGEVYPYSDETYVSGKPWYRTGPAWTESRVTLDRNGKHSQRGERERVCRRSASPRAGRRRADCGVLRRLRREQQTAHFLALVGRRADLSANLLSSGDPDESGRY